MSLWELPKSVEIDGKEYKIRSDYRAILDILSVLASPDYEDDEKFVITLTIFYEEIPENAEMAYEKFIRFVDMGIDSQEGPKTMDWEQDAHLIISGVNRVMGKEIRELDYLHWWTFLGAYMEIGEGAFSTIVSIRSKKAKGKPLDKWEKDFYKENKKQIDFTAKYSDEEKAEIERLKAILDG